LVITINSTSEADRLADEAAAEIRSETSL